MLSTIGYEGADLSDFVRTLVSVKVQLLIDVRERAQSRKRGFSKSALSKALADVGIDYLHLRELGDPKEGREAARSGDWARFRAIYADVLETPEAKLALDVIEGFARDTKTCLLCYERNPEECHRKRISEIIDLRTKSKTQHLGVRAFEQAA